MIPRLDDLFERSMSRRADHLVRRLAPHIPLNSRLLDIGSGTGHNARALEIARGLRCVEVDVVDFHVVGPGPTLFDGSHLPFPEGSFDFCLLAFVLNYAEDPVTLLLEAGRVASQGVLLFQSTCGSPWGRVALRARNWLQGRFAFGVCRSLGLIPPVRLSPQFQYVFSRGQLEAIVDEAGLLLRRFEPEFSLASISRDLIIIERPGISSASLLAPSRKPP